MFEKVVNYALSGIDIILDVTIVVSVWVVFRVEFTGTIAL